jgi:hypothetical protein
MDGLRVEDRATIGSSTDERNRELADGAEGDRPIMGHENEAVAVTAEDAGLLRPAQPGGALRHGVENRLDVGRRAADHPQDLSRRRLLFEGLFRLVEQAHVLDGDDGLVGEGLEHLDLLVGEGAHV